MQVTHAVDSDAVAVIGGGRKRNFSIQTSAHAFRLMSEALYSNKEEAVVRETISNAIDAHIRAGTPERAVEITITENEFTVRDFGAGIHDDDIADVFCSMFGSDKTDDDTQIGGFGAGAKAPFAIADHFTVTSCHKGKRTIYSMHKEGDDGLPVCQTMTAGHCGIASGLTVSVPTSHHGFGNIIRRFVLQGGFAATLNGEMLKTRDYTELRQKGYGAIKNNWRSETSCRVLLGNVSYPIETSRVSELGGRFLIEGLNTDFMIMLHALPGEIAPTPSREGVSYTEQTLESLRKIFARAVAQSRVTTHSLREQVICEAIKETGRYNLKHWDTAASRIISEKLYDSSDSAVYAGADGVALARIRSQINATTITEAVRSAGTVLRDNAHSLRAAVKERNAAWRLNDWLKKDLLKLRLKQLARILGDNLPNANYISNRDKYEKFNVKPTGYYREPVVGLRIAIARTKRDYDEHPNNADIIVLNKKITEAEIAGIKTRAAKFGFVVEIAASAEPKKAPVPRAKPIKENHKFMPFHFGKVEHWSGDCNAYISKNDTPATLTEKPAAYLGFKTYKPVSSTITGFHGSSEFLNSSFATALNGALPNVVVAMSQPELRLLEKNGVPRVGDWLIKQLTEAVASNPSDTLFALAAVEAGRRTNSRGFRVSKQRKLAYIMLDEPYIEDAALDDIWRTARLAFQLFKLGAKFASGENLLHVDNIATYENIVANLRAQTHWGKSNAWRKKITDMTDIYGDLSYTTFGKVSAIITAASGSGVSGEHLDDLAAILDFHQRRLELRS